MKGIKRFALVLAALALAAALPLCPAVSAANLDEIEKYFITVRLQPDGSAEIDYDIHWKVLDSTSAGPLEWVKIGVPNQNVEPVRQSDTIASLYPWSEGGDYVRLDLDRRYYAGETVRLEFTLQVTHIYELYDDGSVNFEFTPGWFDEAKTKQLTFTWEDGAARASYAAKLDGSPVTGDLTGTPNGVQGEWTDLPEGARLTFTADYADQSAFAAGPLDPGMDRNSADTGSVDWDNLAGSGLDVGEVLWLAFAGAVIAWIIVRRMSGGYFLGGFGGWYGPHYHGGPRPPRGGGSGSSGGFGGGSSRGSGAGRRSGGGCACACACVSCACACACAGGGRAGCSAKELKGAVDAAALRAKLRKEEG